MNERARAPAPAAPAESSPPATEAVRPKLMRRPAHFSTSPAGTSVVPITLAVPQPAPAEASAPPMWQDDGRFAIALLVVLIGINLGVMLWLSLLTPGPRVTVVSQSAGAIAASLAPQSGDGVTVYTPDEILAPAIAAPAHTE